MFFYFPVFYITDKHARAAGQVLARLLLSVCPIQNDKAVLFP